MTCKVKKDFRDFHKTKRENYQKKERMIRYIVNLQKNKKQGTICPLICYQAIKT